MDIKGFFEAIDHDLLLKAVDKPVQENWQRRYIKCWLTASVQHPDGTIEQREKGTSPGGVISPLLANLFLHDVFDVWVEKHCQGIQLVRYADDIICHGRTEPEVRQRHQQLTQRFTECGLTLHPEKTKIVYCNSGKHTADYERISFDFLGFTFRPRQINSRDGHGRICPRNQQKSCQTD